MPARSSGRSLTAAGPAQAYSHRHVGKPGELLRLWREEVLRDPATGKYPSPRDAEERGRQVLEEMTSAGWAGWGMGGPIETMRLSHQTIRNWEAWESSQGRYFTVGLKVLDEAYGADGALEGLALATPKVFPERHVWAHNFNPPELRVRSAAGASPAASRPGPRTLPRVATPAGRVWAWARPGPEADGIVDVNVQWGVFEAHVRRVTGDDGLFLTSRVSTPHPAAFLTFNGPPGWVNFGYGRIPDALGVDTLREVHVMSLREGSQSLLRLFQKYWGIAKDHFGPLTAGQQAMLALLDDPSARLGRRDATQAPAPASTDTWTGPYDGAAFQRLREARNMSRSYVHAEAGVSGRQLGHFEDGGATPDPYLRSRLDVLYGADGYTCRDLVGAEGGVRPIETGSSVTFPGHWVGPVALTFTAPDGAADIAPVDLRWGSWHSPLLVRSDLGLTCRCDVPGEGVPLIVDHPADWKLRVELGYNPDAVDVNGGNWDVAEGAGDHLFRYHRDTYVRLLRLLGSPDAPD